MHQYLKAVGFSVADPVETPELLKDEIFYDSDNATMVQYGEYYFVQREKSMSSDPAYDLGVFACGFVHGDEVRIGNIHPYVKGRRVTVCADIVMERNIDGESYIALFEYDNRNFGLLFEVLNAPDILNADRAGRLVGRTGIILSGLSNGGEILLPLYEGGTPKEDMVRQENKKNLIRAARQGDADAASKFAREDIALYHNAKQLLKKTDLYSVVKSTLTPKGIIPGEYHVLGEIMEIKKIKNSVTGEEIYIMTLKVNELLFDVAVPVTGVMGEVKIGRRFKGELHLQGCISLLEGN